MPAIGGRGHMSRTRGRVLTILLTALFGPTIATIAILGDFTLGNIVDRVRPFTASDHTTFA